MKPCLNCGKPVNERPNREVRFCSIACYNVHQTKRREKPCPQCGAPFTPPRNHGKQKYCSTTCRDTARRMSVERACAQCGKPVVRKRHRAARLERSFCNSACNRAWRRANAPSGEQHPQYVEHVAVICPTCDKTGYRIPSRVKKYNFCGVPCRLEWQRTSGYVTGANSPTWLGGHTDYRGPNWPKQSAKARARDGHTCQRCRVTEGELGKTLDVHHIKPWRDFGGDYRAANQLDNLISYCNVCHLIVEWEQGSRAAPSPPGSAPRALADQVSSPAEPLAS